MTISPSNEEREEILLSCRYGELDEVMAYAQKYGNASLSDLRDVNGNTVLHMICANGHKDLLDYLLPLVPPSLLAEPNSSGSTPLHWAALNMHMNIVKGLVDFSGGPGLSLIDTKNNAGRTALGEAEMAGWEEGSSWLVGIMNLDDGVKTEAGEVKENETIMDGDGDTERLEL